MPRLKWLTFHMPMSSPHRIKMFGFFFGIVQLLAALNKMQKNAEKGEDADQEQENRHRENRRLQTLFCDSRDCGKTSVPQVAKCPVVLPNRDYGRQHAAANQAKPHVVGHLRKARLSAGDLAEMIKK